LLIIITFNRLPSKTLAVPDRLIKDGEDVEVPG
jgi:hypothetical protein